MTTTLWILESPKGPCQAFVDVASAFLAVRELPRELQACARIVRQETTVEREVVWEGTPTEVRHAA